MVNQSTLTKEGLNRKAALFANHDVEGVKTMALGKGTGTPSPADESMFSELHRGIPETTPLELGVMRYGIEVSGGSEIPAYSNISEFGLFDSNGVMLYHEVRDPITVNEGVVQEFVTFMTDKAL